MSSTSTVTDLRPETFFLVTVNPACTEASTSLPFSSTNLKSIYLFDSIEFATFSSTVINELYFLDSSLPAITLSTLSAFTSVPKSTYSATTRELCAKSTF